MSSSPLYLAIVVVWLIVLVPMLLRKDSVDVVHDDQRRGDEDPAPFEADEHDGVEDPGGAGEDREEEPDAVRAQGGGEYDPGSEPEREIRESGPGCYAAGEPRARVIARRRRRTTVLTLVNVATIVAVLFGLGPWWVTVPPVLLFAGHLVLLREAAKADAERRQAVARARRREALRARRIQAERRREAEREAEVIALRERRNQVYDQYADARLRAAGD